MGGDADHMRGGGSDGRGWIRWEGVDHMRGGGSHERGGENSLAGNKRQICADTGHRAGGRGSGIQKSCCTTPPTHQGSQESVVQAIIIQDQLRRELH